MLKICGIKPNNDVVIPDLDCCVQHEFHDTLEPYSSDKKFYLYCMANHDDNGAKQLQTYIRRFI